MLPSPEMDDDVKARLEGLDEKVSAVDKRIGDVRWGVNLAFGLIGFVVALALVLGTLNLKAEKDGLQEFRKEVKTEIGRGEASPDVELIGANRRPLADQTVVGKLAKDEAGNSVLTLPYFIRNSGDGLTGRMYLKLYTRDGIPLVGESADEPNYKYELAINPDQLNPNELPGKYEAQWVTRVSFGKDPGPARGSHPALIKVYYGKGRVARAPITIRID